MSTIQLDSPPRAAGRSVRDAALALIEPGSAFARGRAPAWAIGFAAASVLAVAGAVLCEPAVEHVLLAPGSGLVASGVPESTIGAVRRALQLQSVFAPVLVLFVAAWYVCALAVAAVVSRRTTDMRALWSLAIYAAALDPGLASLVRGSIEHLRGIDAYIVGADLYGVIPSLATFSGSANPHVLALLSAINPITAWVVFVLAGGFASVTGARRGVALAAALATVGTSVAAGALLAR